MMKKPLGAVILAMLAALPLASSAEDRIKLDQTTVIDNHELPKVTYIVPWQAAQLPAPEKPPLDALIDQALTPLDRDTLRSRIQYYYATTPAVQGSTSRRQKDAK
jgi:hypothetical protein